MNNSAVIKGKTKKHSKASERKGQKTKISVWKYIVTGVSAGLANGLFGGGGGMLVVPMLVYLLKTEPKCAHATAIFIILPLSVTSGIFYASFGSFVPYVGIPVLIGVVVGGIVGALLLSKLSSKWIVIIFSIVMAAAGVKMLIF